MATVVLCSIYDERCLGLRTIGTHLRDAGHQVLLVLLGRYDEAVRLRGQSRRVEPGGWGMDRHGLPVKLGYSGPLLREDREQLLTIVRDVRPDLVGFSLRSGYFQLADALSREIKREFFIPVVYGGVGPSLEPERAIRVADAVCIGEGEEPMADFMRALSRGSNPRRVRSFWVKVHGRITRNALRPLQTDLDVLPGPWCNTANTFTIRRGTTSCEDPMDGRYETTATRGCFFDCAHCDAGRLQQLYSGRGRPVRRKSVQALLRELEEAVLKSNVKTISFHDECFLADKNWVREFAVSYRERIRIPFRVYTHPLFAEHEELRLLAQAGLTGLITWMPSGSRRMLSQVFNVQPSREQLTDGLKAVLSADLVETPVLEICTGHPEETEEDRMETLHYIAGLGPRLRLRVFSFHNGGADASRGALRFWDRLYLLAASRVVSKPRLGAISRSAFFRSHPWALSVLLLLHGLRAKASKALAPRVRDRGPKA